MSRYIIVRRSTGPTPEQQREIDSARTPVEPPVPPAQSANASPAAVPALAASVPVAAPMPAAPSSGPAAAPRPAAMPPTPRRPLVPQPKLQPVSGVVMLCAGLAIAGVVIALLQLAQPRLSDQRTAGAPLLATDAATAPVASATAAPTMLPLPVFGWDVQAYDDRGQLIGPLAAGRPYTITAFLDDGWVSVSAPDWQGAPQTGTVRVRAVDLLRVPPPATPTLEPTMVPTPAPPPEDMPPPATPVPCTLANAPYRVDAEVNDDHGAPIGHVTQASCVSQADAQAQWDSAAEGVREAVRARSTVQAATQQALPTRTPVP